MRLLGQLQTSFFFTKRFRTYKTQIKTKGTNFVSHRSFYTRKFVASVVCCLLYFFYFHDFFQTSPDCQQPTWFVYWFFDEFRSIKEVQKASRPFWIYILMFTQPIWFIHVFLLFSIYCNIYVTNLIKDVYEVNNGRQYQFKSNFWTHMNIMRRRSIFKDINRLTII